jgi:hypothetical protein
LSYCVLASEGDELEELVLEVELELEDVWLDEPEDCDELESPELHDESSSLSL